jgi:hypothetical protein
MQIQKQILITILINKKIHKIISPPSLKQKKLQITIKSISIWIKTGLINLLSDTDKINLNLHYRHKTKLSNLLNKKSKKRMDFINQIK